MTLREELHWYGGKLTLTFLSTFSIDTPNRCTATIDLEVPIIGIGDHAEKKQAEKLAALSAVYQLHGLGVVSFL